MTEYGNTTCEQDDIISEAGLKGQVSGSHHLYAKCIHKEKYFLIQHIF